MAGTFSQSSSTQIVPAGLPRYAQSLFRRVDVTAGGVQVGLGSLSDYGGVWNLLALNTLGSDKHNELAKYELGGLLSDTRDLSPFPQGGQDQSTNTPAVAYTGGSLPLVVPSYSPPGAQATPGNGPVASLSAQRVQCSNWLGVLGGGFMRESFPHEYFLSLNRGMDHVSIPVVDSNGVEHICLVDKDIYQDNTVLQLRKSPGFYIEYKEPGAKWHAIHRLIMPFKEGFVTDHISRDICDNRRSNLRYATHEQNMQNRKKHRNNTSGYRGVFRNNGGWQAIMSLKGKNIHIASGKDIVKVAKARDLAVLQQRGEFPVLNFPELKDEYLKQVSSTPTCCRTWRSASP